MSCAHPLSVNPTVNVFGKPYSWNKFVDVPCGYCVNCRRDYQNYICDRAKYEYCHRLTASFVTLTYDDPHLYTDCVVSDNFGALKNADGQLRTTLVYKHIQNFIHSIRQHFKNEKKRTGKSISNVLMQEDFAYVYCGEYGGLYNRPHFHVLFFGLDFAYCKKLFRDKWKFGIIDVLPLLDGGIRYVTKYMDKALKGNLAFYEYDVKGLARPHLKMSKGFGQNLLWDNVEDIIDHFWTYRCEKGRRRPISSYWRSLITGCRVSRDPTKLDWKTPHPVYVAYKKAIVADKMRSMHLQGRGINVYSDFEQRKFRLQQALAREYDLKRQLRNEGSPVPDDVSECIFSKYGFTGYNGKKVRRLPTAKQRLLAEEYQHHLFEDFLNVKFPAPKFGSA